MADELRQEILDICFSKTALACKNNIEFNFLCIIEEATRAIKNVHSDNDTDILADVVWSIRELLDDLHE